MYVRGQWPDSFRVLPAPCADMRARRAKRRPVYARVQSARRVGEVACGPSALHQKGRRATNGGPGALLLYPITPKLCIAGFNGKAKATGGVVSATKAAINVANRAQRMNAERFILSIMPNFGADP